MATATQLEKIAPGMPGQLQWMDRLAGLWARGKVRWASMLPAERNWALGAAALLLALIGGLMWYGVRTDWRTLYADLDPEDVRQTGLMSGTGIDVHQAMIAAGKASMACELTLAVRNKAVQAYQSVIGMQF